MHIRNDLGSKGIKESVRLVRTSGMGKFWHEHLPFCDEPGMLGMD